MTPADLRAWRDRIFCGIRGKNAVAAEALGLTRFQFERRLCGRSLIREPEARLAEAIEMTLKMQTHAEIEKIKADQRSL